MKTPALLTPPASHRRSELAAILWSFRREFVIVGVLSMIANVLMLTPTLYMLQIFDRVLVSRSELTLLMVTLIIVAFFIVMAFAEWVRSRLLVGAGLRFDEALNERIFHASFRAELEQSGHNPAQALNDLNNIRQFLTGNGTIALFDAPWTPVYVAVMFMLHPVLGWMSVLFVANLVGFAIYSQRRAAKPAAERARAEAEVTQFLFAKLRNSEVVESMGMLGGLRRRWRNRHRNLLDIQSRGQDTSQRMTSFVKFLRYTQQSASLGVGAVLAIQGEITVGSMIAANVLMSRASAPIEVIVSTWSAFLAARTSYDRLRLLLGAHPAEVPGVRVAPPAGNIRLAGLVATVPGRKEPILKGLDLEFPAGQFTAILGPSGSGKSTLARALLGIWPHTEGEVLLDGEPLGSWDRAALGKAIGYLPQDVELFDGTIAENIARFGELDPEHVILAAQRAGMHEMILRFPLGYDTRIGENGSVLSGGQKQRIALARALYNDPTLIVLDEPNANLDDAGEMALINAVRDLKARGRTVFLITHRPGTLAIADRVLVLDNGAIRFDGPRDALLAAQPGQSPAQPPGRSGLAPQPS